MKKGHNVIVNFNRNSNVNDNVSNNYPRNSKDETADYLVRKLGNERYRTFYCLVANRLSPATIHNNLEIAMTKGKNPAKYFSWLCKNSM